MERETGRQQEEVGEPVQQGRNQEQPEELSLAGGLGVRVFRGGGHGRGSEKAERLPDGSPPAGSDHPGVRPKRSARFSALPERMAL